MIGQTEVHGLRGGKTLLMARKLDDLTTSERAEVFGRFLIELREINKKSGTVYGTIQIIERFEEIAVEKGFLKCPCCKRGGE